MLMIFRHAAKLGVYYLFGVHVSLQVMKTWHMQTNLRSAADNCGLSGLYEIVLHHVTNEARL